jgi:hypothetical protein
MGAFGRGTLLGRGTGSVFAGAGAASPASVASGSAFGPASPTVAGRAVVAIGVVAS